LNKYRTHTCSELTKKEIINHIRNFYTKGLKSIDSEQTINAFTQVEKILNNFELKEKYKLRIGVTSVIFEDKSFFAIPNDYKKNINGFDITVGSNYSLMSEIPDYAAYLEISNAF